MKASRTNAPRNPLRSTPRFWRPALVLFLLAPALAAARQVAASEDLAPAPGQAKVLREAVSLLGRNHYRKVSIDDGFSRQVLERYLEVLDPLRSFFLASDVAEFERSYGAALDEAVQKSDLAPAFAIYRRYRERLEEALRFQLQQVERGLDELELDGNETLELDRRDAPWPADRRAAEELWRKRFVDDVLRLRLADGDDAAIAETLAERYEGVLARARQTKSEDVLSLFANSVTYVYDPHTVYFAPRLAEDFDIAMSLSFEGIGALLGSDGVYARVERLIPGGPAELSGELEPLDRIRAVGQEEREFVDVVGWRIDDVVQLIRGPKGTRVRLSILRGEGDARPRTIELVRDQVKLEEQAARKELLTLEQDGRSARVGVIELPAFYEDFAGARRGDPEHKSSTRDVVKLLSELLADGAEGIVLDLRRNGGGSLEEAVNLTGLFIGPKPVVQVKDAAGKVVVLASSAERMYDGPLVVMVDRISASASEIVAGALQDYGRALVVGSRTFGKGTVQNAVRIGGAQLNLTQAKFYRVSGASTQLHGVAPDLALPDPFDEELIGESTERTALPYDRIAPARFTPDTALARALGELARLHAERAASDPDFVSVVERVRFQDESRDVHDLPLNEALRRAQLDESSARLLAIENARRRAHGQDPLADLAELAELDAESEDELDPLVEEAARIALDLGRLVRSPSFAADHPADGSRLVPPGSSASNDE